MEGYVPDEDATVVSRLHQAGAVLLGKQAMGEFAIGSLKTEVIRQTTESVALGLRHGRVQQRLSGGGRGGTMYGSLGHGHGRLHSRTGFLLRRCGAEADLRPGQPPWRCAAELVP